jgi:cell division protein FtsZ
MGIGAAVGPNRAIEAARHAIHSSLLEVTIDGATDAIVNITGSERLSLREVDMAIAEIRNNCGKDLNIIYGTAINNDLEDEIVITVVATGYELKAQSSGYDELAETIYRNMSDENITYDGLTEYTSEDVLEEEIPYNSNINDIFGAERRSRREEKRRLKEEEKKNKEVKQQKQVQKQPAVAPKKGIPDWLKR